MEYTSRFRAKHTAWVAARSRTPANRIRMAKCYHARKEGGGTQLPCETYGSIDAFLQPVREPGRDRRPVLRPLRNGAARRRSSTAPAWRPETSHAGPRSARHHRPADGID